MCEFNRWDVVSAYYWYSVLWGPTQYDKRLHMLKYKPSVFACLEDADYVTKLIYGRLVMRHQRLYIGFNRLYKRKKVKNDWPGTYNMPGNDIERWLKGKGLLEAVLSVTREA